VKGLTVRPGEGELAAPNLKTLLRLVVDGFLAPLRDPARHRHRNHSRWTVPVGIPRKSGTAWHDLGRLDWPRK